MSPNPAVFVKHLQKEGYHPRSNKHSNAISEAIAKDLVTYCPRIREKAAAGLIVYDLNFTLMAGTSEWNVDLVIGSPEIGSPQPASEILRQRPSSVEIAIEIKSVMTEHRKAVKNRKRDLEAHHEHVHNYNPKTIAGGVLIINASESFKSPLRRGITRHKHPRELVKHCINELRSVSEPHGPIRYGLDARCAIVVVHDNIVRNSSRYMIAAPAPAVGDPLHYDAFIQSIWSEYTARF